MRARNKEAEVLLKGLQGLGQQTREASAPFPAPRAQGMLTVAEQLRLLQDDDLTSSSSAQSSEGVYYDLSEEIMPYLDGERVPH